MKKYFTTGVIFGVGLTSLTGVSEAQYFGSPSNNGLVSSSYPNASYANAQYGSPYRPASGPLRIGGNFPQVAQQGGLPFGAGTLPGHQHIQVAPSGQLSQNQPLGSIVQPQYGSVIPAQGVPFQAGPMSITPSYTAPLPPVNSSAAQSGAVPHTNLQHYPGSMDGLGESIQPIPMNPGQFNVAPSNQPSSQQNYQSYPSTHASTYGSYGNVPSGSLYQSSDNANYGSCSGSPDGSCGASYGVNPYMSGPVAVSPWIFGAGGLIFRRVDNDNVRLSSDTNMPTPPYLTTGDARMRTAGGYELFGGRYFGCGQYAILGSYWSLQPSDESRTVYGGGGTGVSLYTNLPFNFTPGSGANPYGITMPGNNAYFWYDNAQAHQIVRGQDFNNVEVNLASFALGGASRQGYGSGGFGAGGFGAAGFGSGGFGGSGWTNGRYGRSGYSGLGRHGGHGQGFGGCQTCGQTCGQGSCNECTQPACSMPCTGPTNGCGPIIGAQCSPLRFTWFGGVRWFQFSDRMSYATSQDDAIIGNGTDFFYRNNVRNDLVGFQLGGLANYCCGSRFSLYAGSKFGVYNNRTKFDSFAGNLTSAATVQNGSYAGQAYNIMTTENNLALLGEGELGTRARISNGWSATCGYRLIGVSGIATAPGQIPYDFSRLNDARDIKANDSLILHGVTVGVLYNW